MCALEAEEGFTTAPDGRRIFYRISGKGPFAIVMPPNWGVDSYVYTKGLSSLEFWLALVAFDPRGVGRSESVRSGDEFAIDVTARDAVAVADALHLERGVVIGHSGGGAVALAYTLAHPERVSHLILISTAAAWIERGAESPDVPYPSTEDEMRRQFAASIPLALHEPSKFSRAMHELLPRMRFSPERFRWTANVEFDAYDLRPKLSEVRVPVLILHGREDRVVSVHRAEDLQKGILGSHLAILDECGHWPFVEKRQEFVAAVTQFLDLGGPRDRRSP